MVNIKWKYILTLFSAVAITAVIFIPSLSNEFTNWDDPVYVLHNPLIKNFSLTGFCTIWSTFQYMGNYHPLTLMSFSLDYYLHKFEPSGYHFTNFILHLVNTTFVFVFIFMLSNNQIIAFLTALLFGIHPMHVEAVAWISARKEVLYSFFYLGAIVSYAKYVRESKRVVYYYFSFILFCFSILSKATAASLPVIMLLIDYFSNRKISKRVFVEKIPFFLIAISLGIAAVFAQQASKSIQLDAAYNFIDRIAFICYSLVNYLYKLIIPYHLSALYLYPEKIDGFLPNEFFLYPVIIIIVILMLRTTVKHRKIIMFGAAFFLTSIFMVLQIIPVGRAIMADRYSYLPSIGIFYILGEGIIYLNERIKSRWSYLVILLHSIVIGYMIVLSLSSFERCKVWKNGVTLWTDVIEKDLDNPGHYNQRGQAYLERGDYENALYDFNRAIDLKKDYTDAYLSRGITHMTMNNFSNALSDFLKAAVLDPGSAIAFYNKGLANANLGHFSEAIVDYSKAIQLRKDYPEAYVNRGVAYSYIGNKTAACQDLQFALEVLKFREAGQFYDEICR